MAKGRFNLTIETRPGHLTARAAGDRTLDNVRAMAFQIAQAALDAQRTKVLVDVRDLRGRLGLLDNYLLAGSTFQALPKGLRQAAIVDRGPHPLRGWALETLARNRGFNLRLFTSHEEAAMWLESAARGEPTGDEGN